MPSHYLDEGELLAHALVHSGAEAQVGEGLLLLLSLRPEPVRVELLIFRWHGREARRQY